MCSVSELRFCYTRRPTGKEACPSQSLLNWDSEKFREQNCFPVGLFVWRQCVTVEREQSVLFGTAIALLLNCHHILDQFNRMALRP